MDQFQKEVSQRGFNFLNELSFEILFVWTCHRCPLPSFWAESFSPGHLRVPGPKHVLWLMCDSFVVS